MTYAQLLGSLGGGSVRLGTETSLWCPLLAAAAVVLLVAAFRLIARADDEATDADAA